MKLNTPLLPSPETLIFDFGNVLIDIDLHKTGQAFEQLGIPPIDPREIHPQNSGIFLDMELGTASTDDFLIEMRRRACNPMLEAPKILDAWNALLLPFDWSRFELLRQLKQNYRVALLSNTNLLHHQYLEARFEKQNPWGICFVDLFDRVFYSDELGLRKPTPEIYQTVQSELGAAPETIWFVDDNAPNLVAPAALGWHTHHLTGGERIETLFVADCQR